MKIDFQRNSGKTKITLECEEFKFNINLIPKQQNQQSKNNNASIIGGTIMTVGGVLLICVVAFLIIKNRKQ